MIVRLPLEGSGAICLEGPESNAQPDGPVKSGRVGDAVRDLPRTLQESLAPIREAARVVLDHLRDAGPRSIEVEFGVNLSAKAGAVITSGETATHLKVRMVWESPHSGPSGTTESGAQQ